MSAKEPSELICLVSKEGHRITLNRELLRYSLTLHNAYNDATATVINVPNLDSDVLAVVARYLRRYHSEHEARENWEEQFVPKQLLDRLRLLLAAVYLDIQPLQQLLLSRLEDLEDMTLEGIESLVSTIAVGKGLSAVRGSRHAGFDSSEIARVLGALLANFSDLDGDLRLKLGQVLAQEGKMPSGVSFTDDELNEAAFLGYGHLVAHALRERDGISRGLEGALMWSLLAGENFELADYFFNEVFVDWDVDEGWLNGMVGEALASSSDLDHSNDELLDCVLSLAEGRFALRGSIIEVAAEQSAVRVEKLLKAFDFPRDALRLAFQVACLERNVESAKLLANAGLFPDEAPRDWLVLLEISQDADIGVLAYLVERFRLTADDILRAEPGVASLALRAAMRGSKMLLRWLVHTFGLSEAQVLEGIEYVSSRAVNQEVLAYAFARE